MNHSAKTSWLFGHHAVKAALKIGRRKVYEMLMTQQNEAEYAPLAKAAGLKPQIVDRGRLDKMTPQPHQGVALQVGGLPVVPIKDLYGCDLLLMLDQVTDPHNVGACLRSANAFGCGGVILPNAHSPKDSPIIAKAAAGAFEETPLVVVANLAQTLENLKQEGFWVVGLDGYAAKTLDTVDMSGKIVIVMGSEGDGLRDLIKKKCDFLAKLPMQGSVESLNVSVAAGISLYEARRPKK